MFKLFHIVLTGIVMSLYMFPFSIPGWPMNTKMTLAVVGLFLLVLDKIKNKSVSFSKDFVWISILALGVSAMAQFSTIYNHTQETAYTDYIISFWVWMSAAYVVVAMMRASHGDVSVRIIGNYMIGVCTVQCLLAYLVMLIPTIKSFVDYFMGTSFADVGRLYGLGVWLDPSGLRLAAVLVIITALAMEHGNSFLTEMLYTVAFFVIAVFGNMISRTTSVGIVLSAFYAFTFAIVNRESKKILASHILGYISVLLVMVIFVTYSYNSDDFFRRYFRFGFEGVFSLFEKGYWETNSTNILKGMIHWPREIKTWVIGDGYLENPGQDPNYLGPIIRGYYMGTDIGYLRFLWYFGLFGLMLMIAIFIKATYTCIINLSNYVPMFIFLLISSLVFWYKVSSDIIMIYAPFLILSYQQQVNKKPTRNILENEG